MKRNWLIVIGGIILFPILTIFFFLIFQKPITHFKNNGKVVAVARRSVFAPILNDGTIDIYSGKERVFSLWEDFFDSPVFIYPFADGKRFLCDYDDDTAMLDFVVDLNASNSNRADSANWPSDEYLRSNLARMATNVVFNTTGIVRLPNHEELQEVSDSLASANPKRESGGYFFLILGNWDKEFLLRDLATNRQSFWPMK